MPDTILHVAVLSRARRGSPARWSPRTCTSGKRYGVREGRIAEVILTGESSTPPSPPPPPATQSTTGSSSSGCVRLPPLTSTPVSPRLYFSLAPFLDPFSFPFPLPMLIGSTFVCSSPPKEQTTLGNHPPGHPRWPVLALLHSVLAAARSRRTGKKTFQRAVKKTREKVNGKEKPDSQSSTFKNQPPHARQSWCSTPVSRAYQIREEATEGGTDTHGGPPLHFPLRRVRRWGGCAYTDPFRGWAGSLSSMFSTGGVESGERGGRSRSGC